MKEWQFYMLLVFTTGVMPLSVIGYSTFKRKNWPMFDYKEKITRSLKDKPKEKSWFYISYRDEETDTHFTGAVIVQAESNNMFEAWDVGKPYKPANSKLGEYAMIPEKDVPAEQYRNRLLTREEVLNLWPEKAGK